ncbi:hypothetical protein [Mangrovicella endophytica]|uniref:hypothetical protein n=1 Tax=Mangrovicella endophytica TaxID=2066697 RepID=UPI0018E4BB45|nr:hypothetical protein [Mangrovicella endophytica]
MNTGPTDKDAEAAANAWSGGSGIVGRAGYVMRPHGDGSSEIRPDGAATVDGHDGMDGHATVDGDGADTSSGRGDGDQALINWQRFPEESLAEARDRTARAAEFLRSQYGDQAAAEAAAGLLHAKKSSDDTGIAIFSSLLSYLNGSQRIVL